MADGRTGLWPYSNKVALIAAPLIWCFVAVCLYAIHTYWRLEPSSFSRLVLVGLAIGLIPLLLLLLDYIAQSRAVIDVKGVKLDFSRTDIAIHTAVVLPDNIGKAEPLISDSSAMEIVSTLESAVTGQVVRLDLKDGNAWWVTRLLALCAGATRVRSPKAIVFVGLKENVDYAFLGWAAPPDLLRALVAENETRGNPATTYGAIYRKAVWLTKQVAVFGKPAEPPRVTFIPADPEIPTLSNEVQRYFKPDRRKYVELGEAALEQILMDQLGLYQMEKLPDRLTLGRLETLFAPWLYRDTVNLDKPKEQQLSAFLESSCPYVALVRGGRYQGLIERQETESSLLRQLLKQPEQRQ